ADGRWSREMAHDWGSLGRWTGQVTYRPAGKTAGQDRYDYALGLVYQPPAGGKGEQPFAVSKADFRLLGGRGSIRHGPAPERVTAAEERFHVRGALAATALGTTAVVGMEEVQLFRVRILDQLPVRGAWSGPRP